MGSKARLCAFVVPMGMEHSVPTASCQGPPNAVVMAPMGAHTTLERRGRNAVHWCFSWFETLGVSPGLVPYQHLQDTAAAVAGN